MKIHVITLSKMQTFMEYSMALKMSLEELGHEVIFTQDKNNTGDGVNIFTQSFQPFVPLNSGINILYQCEELWGQQGNYRVGNGYPYILEMFEEQAIGLRNFGLNAHFCPYGYSPTYETPHLPVVEEDIDMFFFGAYTARRREWIEKIKAHPAMRGKNIVHINKMKGVKKYYFGDDRDKMIMRSKLVLNFKAHDSWMYAPLRGLLAQCKKKMYMIEEPSGGIKPYKNGKHFIMFRNINEFVEKALYWLEKDRQRKEFTTAVYDDIMINHRWSKYLEKPLKEMKIC